jgi:tRNA threonylcarbamoyladenosine biosynthesis protein TsaE
MDKYMFFSNSPAATSGLGKRMGQRLRAGSIIAMIGELGCGKTLLTRGVCAGLGVPLRQVNSPTFVFVNEYQGRLPVFHMDLYRLGNIDEGFEIGILDYLARAESGVIVVEWAEKILSLLPDDYLKVQFQVFSARKRQIGLSARGNRFSSLLKELGKR